MNLFKTRKTRSVNACLSLKRFLFSILFILCLVVVLFTGCKRIEYYILTIATNAAVGGHVSFDNLTWTEAASKTIVRGFKIPIYAKRASGYAFDGWYDNDRCLSTNATCLVSIYSDKTVQAIFEESPVITFEDATLTTLIRTAPGYTGNQEGPIYKADVVDIKDLSLNYQNISSLNGIQHLKNLEVLDFAGNNISDLTPLASLTNLISLNCYGNTINDLSPLAGLSTIQGISFDENNVNDLTPLSGLINLVGITFSDNPITDLTPLANLTNLGFLSFRRTGVTDLSPLSALTNLEIIDFPGTGISDLTPLTNLSKLSLLIFWRTAVTDLSPLSALTNLEILDFSGTGISDLTPLKNLSNLSELNCSTNKVVDLSPLTNLVNLSRLDLSKNRIDNIASLVNNEGIGSGDSVILTGNSLEETPGSDDMHNIQTLINRGVDIQYQPQNAIPVISKTSGPDDGEVIYENHALFKWSYSDQASSRYVVDFVLSKDGGDWEDNEGYGLGNYVWHELTNGIHTLSIKVIDDQDYESNILTWEFEYRAPVTITIQASPAEAGDITFYDTWTDIASRTINADTQINVYSRYENGYVLNGWYEDAVRLSTETTYNFVATSDRTLVALFEPDTPVVFEDATLTACIRNNDDYTGNPSGPIYAQDVADIFSLDIRNNNINSLNGIQHLRTLTLLYAQNNNISDLTPLASVTTLEWLYLDDNNVSNLQPLVNLTKLDDLLLAGNNISDLTPLENLINLTRIGFQSNSVSDITPLVSNVGLDTDDIVYMQYNNLDLTPGSDDMNNIQTLIDRGVNVYY